jgi:cobalt-zinc-cadmium efflux system membrane fusion protein
MKYELRNWIAVAFLVLGVVGGCSSKKSDGGDAAISEQPSAEGGGARISAQAAERAGIEVSAAAPGRIRETLTLYGSIKPNAEQERDIRARYPGVIRSVHKSAGDSVNKGDVLLTVESNESLQVYSVVSPLGGQVLERSANPGDAVDASMVLMKVADLSSVWAEFALFARDLAHVRRGMRVSFRGADADETGESNISYVAPAGHADSQSVVARAIVENRDGRWVPGQFISGDVVTADVQVAVAVAPGAIQKIKGRPVVFVQMSEGFEARAVEIGRHDEAAVEIMSGLAAGEHVVAKNSFVVKAEVLKSEAEED